jgi:hypothetical protein
MNYLRSAGSVNLAAALNQPVDAVANCENRKAGTRNWSGRSFYIIAVLVLGLARRGLTASPAIAGLGQAA